MIFTVRSLGARHYRAAISVGLALTTLVVYLPVTGCDFVTFDDMTYVVDNPHVRDGVTWRNVAWAMTACHASNWHPVSWISHMIDVSLFGMAPGFHHGSNLVVHIASVVGLFLWLSRVSRATVPSGVVAAVFAIHPLHVESVAWISERKDVLSTLFGIAAIAAYCRYASAGSSLLYAAAVGLYCLSLMSKPMLVTLPCLLLLLDYWPLGRLALGGCGAGGSGYIAAPQAARYQRLLLEKIPFFALSFGSSAITFVAQHRGGSVVSTDALPITERLANAAVAYVAYIAKAFYPVDLAVFYPRAESIYPGLAVGCGALVGGLTVMSVMGGMRGRVMPPVMVGWLWYVGTLVPVIGLVQVGAQSMADRYMYFPLVGLTIAFVWWAWEIVKRHQAGQAGFVVVSMIGLILLAGITRRQVGYWKDSETLFSQALAVTGDNPTMLYCRGIAYANRCEWNKAEADFTDAVTLAPRYAKAYSQRGVVYHNLGRADGALADFSTALSLDPFDADSLNNRGNLLAEQGQHSQAIADLEQACRLKPTEMFFNNLGVACAKAEDHESAIRHYTAALRLTPEWVACLVNRGQSHAALKQYREAVADFNRAIAIAPESGSAFFQRGGVFDEIGDRQRAVEDMRAAAQRGHATAQNVLRQIGLQW